MPCDESSMYIGSSVSTDSPRIVESRRLSNKTTNNNNNHNNNTNSNIRSGNNPIGTQAVVVESSRNHYGTVAMGSRPLHSTATFTSTSCSSSSSGSSPTASSSCSPSSFDREVKNDSTNSSSSLILILERANSNDIINDPTAIRISTASKSSLQNHDEVNDNNNCANVAVNHYETTPSCFAVKGATSSLETLAKKKSTRCRRRKSVATSARYSKCQQYASKSLDERLRTDNSNSAESMALQINVDDDDGFVATSTLTKNRETISVLSVLTNASRPAIKVGLQSSTSMDLQALRNLRGSHNRDYTDNEKASYTPTAIKSQQSTISVASIRGTNIGSIDFSNNNNNNNNNSSNNNYSTIIGNSSRSGNCIDNNTSSNLALKVRCNVPSASAPALHRYHNNIPSLARAFSSHSSAFSHSSVPQATITTTFNSSLVKANEKTTTATTTPITTCISTRASTVKSGVTSLVGSTVFLTGKLATNSVATKNFSRVDSSNSLKSTSFNNTKLIKNNRTRTSIHASLGQLPTCTIGAPVASIDNIDNTSIYNGLEINTDPLSMPNNLYSSNSPVDGTTLSPYTTTRTSLERVCYSTGASTMSSASSKTRITLTSNVNSVNVANAFKNSLVNSGHFNNNNARCNHLSGTCNGSCNVTTTVSQTSSTLTRTPNIVNGVASTSSWNNNLAEQETDYVVDPVQGNAYHKGQFLGKGGFARVYLMTDVANGNQYACKIIPKNRMQKIHIQKIAREIMIHKELNHVNVVQMHHYFEDNINVYMLLEPCPRKSLMHVLKYRGKVTEPEARYYMKQMVTGVAYIHSQKVVHRDLKPGNMFLSDGMIVKIGDFGLATRPDGQRRRVTICGTPNYIAPEVLYKQAYSYEADVWALGCILYALLAGQPPFDTATLKETYARICNNRYKKLDDSVVSRSGQDLIRWLLQPIPELRPSLERVKEHAYLTMEYVPTKLAHTCCYRMPAPHAIAPEQSQSGVAQQMGLSSGSVISRALVSTENIDRNKREFTGGAIMQKNIQQINSGTVSQTQLETVKNGEQKKPKVGNWLFRKLPKLPRFRQRLSRLLCPEQKKPDSVMMHRALEACLAEIRCTRAQENPMLVDRIAPLFVTKWIDYSNKYGLGFQLSDRSVGVLFNDSTKMSYTHDRRRVEYATTDDEVTRYRRELDVPSHMEEKLELLRHFTHYMDNFLTNGGEVKEQKPAKQSRTNSTSVPRMRRWLRTDKAIVMELTVPLLQVNFFVDHSKIVVSEGIRGRGYLVTYIDASRQASSYWLNDLRDVGCTAELYERLHYVCKVIAELENEAIFDTPTTVTQQQQHRKSFAIPKRLHVAS